jgi:glycosyltransferase involved in cell wall biosynthesis
MIAENINIKEDLPLVSVAVITYNSSAYILETLESIRRQSYKHIELIIADDCSADNTVSLCENWLNANRSNFAAVVLIAAAKNSGIPANCNRAVKASRGAWVKIIAGDDLLHEHCISLNLDFCRERQYKDMIVISNMIQFVDGTDPKSGMLVPPPDQDLMDGKASADTLQRFFLRSHFGNSPSLFIARNILERVPYDESIPFMEDWPFAINATKQGYYFYYLNAATVYYRISNNSVFASKGADVLFNNFYKKRRPFLFKYIYPNISRWEKAAIEIEYKRMLMMDRVGLNRNNLFCKVVNALSLRITPYYFFNKFTGR